MINPKEVAIRVGMVAGVILGARAMNGSPDVASIAQSNQVSGSPTREIDPVILASAPKLVLSPEGRIPSPTSLKPVSTRIPTREQIASVATPEVLTVRMSDEEVVARGRDFNPQDESHNIANCLKPSFQLAQADQSLVLRVLSWLPLFPTSAEASSAFKTPEDVVSCLKNETLLVDFVKTNKKVDLSKIKPENVKGEFKYKELAEKLAELKLLSLGQGKAMFGSTVEMTFKDGNVIRSRPATMLDDEKEVERRRKNGEKMIFWTGEAYEVVVVDGQLLVLRQDCANLLLQVAAPSPKSEATVIPVSEASTATPRTADTATSRPVDTATNTPVVTTSTATETSVVVTASSTPTNVVFTATSTETPVVVTASSTPTNVVFTATSTETPVVVTATNTPVSSATPTARLTITPQTTALPSFTPAATRAATETPGGRATDVPTKTPVIAVPTVAIVAHATIVEQTTPLPSFTPAATRAATETPGGRATDVPTKTPAPQPTAGAAIATTRPTARPTVGPSGR